MQDKEEGCIKLTSYRKVVLYFQQVGRLQCTSSQCVDRLYCTYSVYIEVIL